MCAARNAQCAVPATDLHNGRALSAPCSFVCAPRALKSLQITPNRLTLQLFDHAPLFHSLACTMRWSYGDFVLTD